MRCGDHGLARARSNHSLSTIARRKPPVLRLRSQGTRCQSYPMIVLPVEVKQIVVAPNSWGPPARSPTTRQVFPASLEIAAESGVRSPPLWGWGVYFPEQ